MTSDVLVALQVFVMQAGQGSAIERVFAAASRALVREEVRNAWIDMNGRAAHGADASAACLPLLRWPNVMQGTLC